MLEVLVIVDKSGDSKDVVGEQFRLGLSQEKTQCALLRRIEFLIASGAAKISAAEAE
jgi:hypothetical protein